MQSHKMLTLARQLEQPFGLAQDLYHAAQLQYYRREARVVHELLEEERDFEGIQRSALACVSLSITVSFPSMTHQ